MIGLLVGTLREFKSDDTERSQTKQVFDFNTNQEYTWREEIDSNFESGIKSDIKNFFTPIVSYQVTTSKITHI